MPHHPRNFSHNRPEDLRLRIREIARERPRFGYRRITVMLRRKGVRVGKNTVFKIYQEEALGLKKQTSKHKRLAAMRVMPMPAKRPGQRWSIDFVTEKLANGRYFRALCVVDQFTRKCLGVEVSERYPGSLVTETLDRIAMREDVWPEMITLDNGPEFTGVIFDEWASKHDIQLDFITSGRPKENGYVESFNARLRDECLNGSIFRILAEAQALINLWRRYYNNDRPHSSLGDRVPEEVWKSFQEDLKNNLTATA